MALRQRRTDPAADGACDVGRDICGQRRTDGLERAACDVDVIAAELATAQHGFAGREQLIARGVTPHLIDHRVRTARFIVRYRGVYAIGHAAVTDAGRIQAALLAAGPGAVASHRTAAALHDLIPSMPPFVEVTVTAHGRRSRSDLVVHRTRNAPHITTVDGLPVTAPLRTLTDLAGTLAPAELERSCSQALVRGLVTERALEQARLLAPGEAAPTRSTLERRFLRLMRDAGLPRPRVNHTIGPYEIDFAWPDQRVLVEVDGWDTHGNRLAFESDRARDADLAAQGYLVLRFTWRQVTREPLVVATRVAQALARR